MSEPKALSPEVQGLIEKIRSQAKLYAERFEYLNDKIDEFENIKFMLDMKEKDFTSYVDTLRTQFEEFKTKNHDSINRTLKELNTESEKYKNINDSLEVVNSFIKEITELKDSIKFEYERVNSDFDRLTTELYQELSKYQKTLKFELNNLLEKDTKQLAAKIKQNQENLKNNETELENYIRLFRVDVDKIVKNITDDNEKLSKTIERETQEYNQYLTKLRDEIKLIELRVDRIASESSGISSKEFKELFDQNLDKSMKDIVTEDELEDLVEKKIDTFEARLRELENENQNLVDENQKNKFKMSMALFVSISSIIGILILFFIIFSKL